jgi:hypothetical protein
LEIILGFQISNFKYQMLQYKIPQDIGIADKIVGPLTLRQLLAVAIGGGISYVLYAISVKLYELNILEYAVIFLPAVISLLAAFIKINGVPFTTFILLTLEYAIKPKKRLWDHRGISAMVAPNLIENKMETGKIPAENKKTRKEVNLDKLSTILDSGGFEHVKEIKHEDIDRVEDEDLMTQAYFGNKRETSETENMYWRTKKSHKKRLEIMAKMPATTVPKKKEEPVKTIPKEQPVRPEVKAPSSPPLSQIKKNETVVIKPVPRQNPPENKTGTVQNKIADKTAQAEPPIRQALKPIPEANRPFSGKKKKRKKKKLRFGGPVRTETQVNTIQKGKPVQFQPAKPRTPEPAVENGGMQKNQEPKGGEIYLEELKKGEIELNLD